MSFENSEKYLDYDESLDPDSEPKFYWSPICENKEPLDKELLRILGAENKLSSILTIRDLDFFRALRGANIKDADKIVEAIEKFTWIELTAR